MADPVCSERQKIRAAIVLRRAEGIRQVQVAEDLGVSLACVSKWSHRFEHEGMAGLQDRPGRGRPRSISAQKVEQVIGRASLPPNHGHRWSIRSMAREVGTSPDTVHRIWRANNIRPHLEAAGAGDSNPAPTPKRWDIAGLYLDAPVRALVLCCEHKAGKQIRPTSRAAASSQSLGFAAHNHRRYGTVSMLAAIAYLNSKMPGGAGERQVRTEWLRFLKRVERGVPREMEMHLIADQGALHEEGSIETWLVRHPRFRVHKTWEGCTWIRLVEDFVGELTATPLWEDSFASIEELLADVEGHLAERSLRVDRFTWNVDRCRN